MASFHARNGAGELLARYSFLEPLLEGRRVLEVGAARATEGASALFLAERGAAAVLSIEAEDADLEAARRTGHHPFVQFHATRPPALRAGTFDLILLADGGSLASAPEEVADLRRLLASGGRLVTAIPAGGAGLPDLLGEPSDPEPPEYEKFVNALADHFPLVEVAAQTATVGWVVRAALGGRARDRHGRHAGGHARHDPLRRHRRRGAERSLRLHGRGPPGRASPGGSPHAHSRYRGRARNRPVTGC